MVQKIAVLGGGTGSLSAVFGLTDQPGWQDKYDITVYQLGWRLGGKGASGRNRQPNRGDRIEEHGLHIWFGFYENAFATIQKCYEELGRAPGTPLATWDEAFKKHNLIGIEEYVRSVKNRKGQWKHWLFDFPQNGQEPGKDDNCCWIVFGCIRKFLSLGKTEFEKGLAKDPLPDSLIAICQREIGTVPELLGDTLVGELRKIHQQDLQDIEQEKGGIGVLVDTIDGLLQVLGDDVKTHEPKYLEVLHDLLTLALECIQSLPPKFRNSLPDYYRRAILLLELAIVVTLGFWDQKVFLQGFQGVSDIDLREWLGNYGATDTLIYSALTRAVYDLFFAFPQGDTGDQTPTQEGNISARSSLHYMSRAICCYKGAIMWKMQAGMGDVVFTPLYQVLKDRGVKFKFFQKITDLIPSPDLSQIDEITLNEQVTLTAGPDAEYNPLYDVKGLPCWPSEPLYEQIVQGEELREQQINLESYWTPWQDVNKGISLKRGQDFDIVICGISLAALENISDKLIAAKPAWQNMFAKVQTVQTQAMQLWLEPPLEELGWERGPVILDAYVEPFNTWADMAQTLPFENWPADLDPKDVAYFCGPMKDANVIPPPSDHGFPDQESKKVEETAINWIDDNIKHLWSNYNWNMLIDPDNRQEQARFEAQYWRCNIDPTERYVLSLSGTDQYRLKPDESGFSNMYLVGDWVNNTFINIGAIEPTVISGLLASWAISGYPKNITCVLKNPEKSVNY